jgi:ATP-dependent Clp protease ATP-binding subunit ClpA
MSDKDVKPPLTGRVSAFIPFLPFSLSETCVGAHKYLLELATEVRRPVNTSFGDGEQLLGNIRLKIRLDASVCQILARGYDPQLGIRSLRKIVRDKVATKLDYEYTSTHDLIFEGRPMEDYVVFVSNGKIRVLRAPSRVANS